MIKGDTLMNIRSLARQGHTQRQIARMTGLHRRTVKKYLNKQALPVYRKQIRQSRLTPYKSLIEGWLAQEDFRATRIHELLIAQGFTGSYDIVQRYVKTLKEKRDRAAYARFETLPGLQAQVDFGDFQITEPDGGIKTVYCFVMVLGYSRHMHVEFIDSCTMPRFLTCHQNAFGFFGGVPAEIVYDNMKNVVTGRPAGQVRWNRTFAGFCAHYGLKPVAAAAYSPWVKGKVERPIDYIRERFWRGYVYRNLSRANRDVLRWNRTVAAERLHGTHRQKVSLRFAQEKPSLGALPEWPCDVSEKVYRRVHKDCQCSFGGNRYVVPHECAGKKVLLKIKDGLLRVFDDDKFMTAYRIPDKKGETLAHPYLYNRLRADKKQLARKYRRPSGKGKATRGLLRHGLKAEVMARPLSAYEEVLHVC